MEKGLPHNQATLQELTALQLDRPAGAEGLSNRYR